MRARQARYFQFQSGAPLLRWHVFLQWGGPVAKAGSTRLWLEDGHTFIGALSVSLDTMARSHYIVIIGLWARPSTKI